MCTLPKSRRTTHQRLAAPRVAMRDSGQLRSRRRTSPAGVLCSGSRSGGQRQRPDIKYRPGRRAPPAERRLRRGSATSARHGPLGFRAHSGDPPCISMQAGPVALHWVKAESPGSGPHRPAPRATDAPALKRANRTPWKREGSSASTTTSLPANGSFVPALRGIAREL